jgi:hypothetical protein
MENVHGVDVSWIHQSHKGKFPHLTSHVLLSIATFSTITEAYTHDIVDKPYHTRGVSSSSFKDAPEVPPKDDPSTKKQPAQSGPSNATSTPEPTQTPRRSNILRRNSGQNPADPNKASPKKASWISSLSSKLSSPQVAQANTPPNTNSQIHAPATTHLTPPQDEPYVPQPPRGSGASFLSNALRRLSSNSQVSSGGKVNGTGGVWPRRVMNVDPNRPRSLIPQLEAAKLRRVAFCVDVEIAGGPRYKDDVDVADKQKLDKDMKLKEKAEGAALKHPSVLVEDKESTDPEGDTPEAPTSIENAETAPSEKKEMSRKKEKKKRSEEERKERREIKRRKAEESGAIPIQITTSRSPHEPVPESNSATTSKPTTDPLRIYRRCCSLRETPVLKRITDQLSNTASCVLATSGEVMTLDLTGSRLQLTDVVTLSDWLAVVPVNKLLLEDADLNDEGIRVLLAGLLAATTPQFSTKHPLPHVKYEERSGVIEKLCLKNNPKISKEGWKHISLFIYMCKSLKSLDISMNPFPSIPNKAKDSSVDCADLFSKAISERIGGSHLEELIMGECSLSAYQIRKIIDAVTMCGITRLGMAGNDIGAEGLEHAVSYIRSGVCQGLDIGGNDLRGHLDILGDALQPDCPLWAISLADCNLDLASLKTIFPGLLNLPMLRFLDLSFNSELFTAKPDALGLLSKYLPMLEDLRRIHLNNLDLAPSQAIALADVLVESPRLAHISMLNNPQLSVLAAATDEESQEEACALYASLMAAARVSHSLVSIDIDIPSQDSSEVVKALAKQVVAYCLRNMESWYSPTGELRPSADAKAVHVPEVLLHLVGDSEGQHDDSEPTSNEDYIVSGQGVVKALNYCLADIKRGSIQSGVNTPLEVPNIKAKAKAMSTNLLDSARKIRIRVQPALHKASKGPDEMAYRKLHSLSLLLKANMIIGRLLFLDNTLKGIIQRFEAEYPETRVDTKIRRSESNSSTSTTHSAGESTTLSTQLSKTISAGATYYNSDSDEEDIPSRLGPRSRHASDVSLAAKMLAKEEGAVHKLGQQVKREIMDERGTEFYDQDLEYANDVDQAHVKLLREKLNALKVNEEQQSESAIDD